MSVRSSILLFVIASVALLNVASCFTSSTAPSLITNRRALASRRNSGRPMYAVAKKTKKTTKKTKKTAKKSDAPETFKKAEFVSSIAEKTGFTKADSEAALAAVLETITEVRDNDNAKLGRFVITFLLLPNICPSHFVCFQTLTTNIIQLFDNLHIG